MLYITSNFKNGTQVSRALNSNRHFDEQTALHIAILLQQMERATTFMLEDLYKVQSGGSDFRTLLKQMELL
jgi:hypothetical protein